MITVDLFHFIFTLALFFGAIIGLAAENFPRHYIVLCASAALVLGNVLTPREAFHLVNWHTLALLLGLFILVEALSTFGFFDWLALSLARRLEHRPLLLFFVLCATAGCLSMVVNNITVMIVMTSLTLRICRYVSLEPVPLMIGEVCCANMMGAATLIGAPPNLLMAETLAIGFNRVAMHMAPIAILCTGVFMLVYDRRHRGELLLNRDPARPLAAGSRPKATAWKLFLRIDFETLIFFMGLFILIGALDHVGVFHVLASRLAAVENPGLLMLAVLWLSALVSAFVDNIPMALAMAYLIKNLAVMSPEFPAGILVWAALTGLTLGGNMTPIGASPNIVAYGIFEKQNLHIGWKKWAAFTVPATLIALVTASLLLWLKFRTGWY